MNKYTIVVNERLAIFCTSDLSRKLVEHYNKWPCCRSKAKGEIVRSVMRFSRVRFDVIKGFVD